MVSSIASVTQLVTLIQAQLSGGVQGHAKKGATPRRAPAAGDAYAAENLGRLIQLRVRQIARDDPQRGRKAFRVFLEAVLLAHFGESLAHDPKFYQLLDDIQAAMENDAASRPLVDSAIGHLLSEQ